MFANKNSPLPQNVLKFALNARRIYSNQENLEKLSVTHEMNYYMPVDVTYYHSQFYDHTKREHSKYGLFYCIILCTNISKQII